jgi:hypothetical protein
MQSFCRSAGAQGSPWRAAICVPPLLRVGRAVLELLTSPDTIAPYGRMVAAEAARSPELGCLFYESAVALLRRAPRSDCWPPRVRAWRLRTGTTAHVAAQFIGLVRGDLMMRAVPVRRTTRPANAKKQATVRMGVEAFCRGLGRVMIRADYRP